MIWLIGKVVCFHSILLTWFVRFQNFGRMALFTGYPLMSPIIGNGLRWLAGGSKLALNRAKFSTCRQPLRTRFVQFSKSNDERHLGVQIGLDGDVVPVGNINGLPNNLKDLIKAGPTAWSEADKVAQSGERIPLADVHLHAPITNPGKVLCVGLNYRCHCEEQHIDPPHEPMFFSKFADTIVGPTDNVVLPTVSTKVDWEVELAVVISYPCYNVKAEKALNYVFGYTIAQDISARDWQKGRNGGQWLLGKSMDTFCPLGPAVVTPNELPEGPHNLNLSSEINGVVKQNSNTDKIIHRIDYIISYLSQILTLMPGDVILTGTPAGVGVFRNPREFLKPGDIITSKMQLIGSMKNPVVAPRC